MLTGLDEASLLKASTLSPFRRNMRELIKLKFGVHEHSIIILARH